jgi:hypothetical protein
MGIASLFDVLARLLNSGKWSTILGGLIVLAAGASQLYDFLKEMQPKQQIEHFFEYGRQIEYSRLVLAALCLGALRIFGFVLALRFEGLLPYCSGYGLLIVLGSYFIYDLHTPIAVRPLRNKERHMVVQGKTLPNQRVASRGKGF